MIGKTVGNYEIKARLGEGGMGVVYLAEHPLIGKKVAIKVLREDMATRPDIVTRFFHEAKAANEIGHPNIVDMLDFGRMRDDQGHELSYIIMELLDGESLKTRLERGTPPLDETKRILGECCSALAASHAKGIIHRDLKPDNIFLCRHAGHSSVKLLDFGIAKLTGHSAVDYKTRTGSIMGTPQYMSPEQCDGAAKIDHRSDIYSLGVVLYEMLTRRVPFESDGFGGVVVGHLMHAPPAPTSIDPSISKEIEAVVLHALEKKPDDRFQSMDEFARALADPAAHLAAYEAQKAQRQAAAPKPAAAIAAGATLALPANAAAAATAQTLAASSASEVSHPPTTTLSGAASEMMPEDEPAPSRFPRVAIIAGAIIGVVVIGGILLLRKPAPVERLPPAKQVAAIPQEVEFLVNSDPEGARIERDGSEVGATPARLRFKRSALPVTLVLRHDGFEDQRRTLSSADGDVFVKLVPVPARPDAAAVIEARSPPPEKKPKKAGPSHHSTKRPKDKDSDLDILEPKF